ncbi:MAG: HAMP domain-containing histidine kinase [Clostridiales bacterium]|nr:HAMP domain-containing histidine kinase [Clostridiales bacterium]
MIKRLRIRFTVLAMVSMLIVLTILIGGINIINYRNIITDADGILIELSRNNGAFALRDEPDPQMPSPDMPAPDVNGPPEAFGELAFSSRYFSVLFDSNGNITETDTRSIFMVDEQSAEDYAEKVIKSGKTKGFSDHFRYLVSKEGDNTRVIFYDCSRSLDSFRNFRNTSIIISAVGMLLVFALIRMLSGLITKPAAESYEKQKRFITDAGHEIKTPLAIINTDTDVLETVVGEDNEWTADIKKQIKNLTSLTEDLVYLSRMEEPGSGSVKQETDLSSLVIEISGEFRSRAVTENKSYGSDIEEDITLTTSKNSIKRICSILLDNAMKYSPEGGKVDIALKKSDKNAVLTVSNELKEKLTDEDIKHLFDRFYRADSSRNSETGGHGLGLSIARAETESIRGKISASKEGNTLTFTVRIPFR